MTSQWLRTEFALKEPTKDIDQVIKVLNRYNKAARVGFVQKHEEVVLYPDKKTKTITGIMPLTFSELLLYVWTSIELLYHDPSVYFSFAYMDNWVKSSNVPQEFWVSLKSRLCEKAKLFEDSSGA